MCAVVTASLTEWHPAVLGRTRKPSARIIEKNPWPERSLLDSRRSDTVTTSVPDAFTDCVSTAGDGYLDVPSNSLEVSCVS
jgi:hypothetical protein